MAKQREAAGKAAKPKPAPRKTAPPTLSSAPKKAPAVGKKTALPAPDHPPSGEAFWKSLGRFSKLR